MPLIDSIPSQRIPYLKQSLLGFFFGLAVVALALLPLTVTRAQPGNDDFNNATVISGVSGSISGTTVGATAQTGEPNFHPSWTGWADDLRQRSIWYAWTAPPGIGPTAFVVTGPAVPVLGVYTGSLGSFTEIGYNQRSEVDDNWMRAQVQISPTAGATYYIGVGSYYFNTFDLSWAPSAPPANDDFADAPPISDGATGMTLDATYEAGEPAFGNAGDLDLGGRSVWYTYAPTESSVTVISLEGSSYNTVLGVYTGVLGSLTEVAWNQNTSVGEGNWSRVSFPAEVGTTYYIGIGGYSGSGGFYMDGGQAMTWGAGGTYVVHILPGAANDNFTDATPISGASGTESAITDASPEAGDPAFHTSWTGWSDDFHGHSIWYQWTAPVGVGATAFTAMSDDYLALGVYTGSLGTLSEVGYNEHSPLDGDWDRAQVVFAPTPGVTYSIGVGMADSHLVTLFWGPATDPPENDDFAEALPLPPEAVGNNIAATFEVGEPTYQQASVESPSDLGRSVWYVYTPDTTGMVSISLAASSFDTVLGVYTGSLGSLTEVAYNDDYTELASRVTFSAEAGTTYYVGVGGCCGAWVDGGQVMEWTDSGTYLLRAIGPGLGTSNDNFADARAISGASGFGFGATEEATAEAGDPNFHPSYTYGLGDLFGHSVWYAWTAPDGIGPTTIMLSGSDNPLALGVYTGSLGSLTEVAYNQRSQVDGDWGRAQVQFTPSAGTTYYIGVGSDPIVGFTLFWAPSAGPTNDNFADALPLPADATGSTVEATHEAGEPTFLGVNADLGGRSVWYTYAAAEPTAVDISLEGSTFDTRLGVYTGSLGSLSQVALNDDAGGGNWSRLSFVAQAGVTYQIGIGGCCGNSWVVDGGQTIRWGDSGTYVLHTTTAPASAPVVTLDPVSQTVDAGQTATFTAAAMGPPTPTVQWQVSTDGSTWTNIPGATSTTLSFTGQAADNGEQYQAVFTNALGSATTSAATLTVLYAPTVTTHPGSQTVNAGQTATFTAAADGNPAPSVQWQVSTDGTAWNDILGETSTTLDFTAQATDSGNQYHAVFSNGEGSATSDAATLTVYAGPAAPTVTTQPENSAVKVGEDVTFTAAASGNPTPGVQWQVNTGRRWTDIVGATDTTLTLANVTLGQSGYRYRAVFTNSMGSAITNPATLTVNPLSADVAIDYESSGYNSTNKTITWVLSVSNLGPDAAQEVEVVDRLARGTKLVSVSSDLAGWTSKTQGSKLTISVGTLSSGASGTITIVTQLGRNVSPPVINSAEVTTTSSDPNLTNNSSTYTVTE